MGSNNWFVVINRSSAKIFEIVRRPDSLNWLRTLPNPLGAEKNRALTRDKPGAMRSRFSQSKGVHKLNGEKVPHDEVALTFAKQVAEFLVQHKLGKDFLGVTIAAEPHMKGLLKKGLEKSKVKMAIQWLEKDLEKMPTERLEKFVFQSKPRLSLSS